MLYRCRLEKLLFMDIQSFTHFIIIICFPPQFVPGVEVSIRGGVYLPISAAEHAVKTAVCPSLFRRGGAD